MSAYCALIVGAGMIGSGYDTPDDENVLTHAHAFHRHPDFEPACFVEPDREKARKAVSVWGGRAYGSLDEAFSGQAFDVVSVCTPTTTHRDVLLDVLGRDIKCVIHEKPLAADMDEAAELMEACGSSPVPVMVNYTRRYMKEMIGIRARIAKGEFGSFVSGSCYYGKGILNNGSHAVDLLRYLIGEVEDVSYVSGRVDYLPQDPSVSCVLGISGGGSFHLIETDQRCFSVFEMDFMFEKKRIRMHDFGFTIEEQDVVEDPVWPGYMMLGSPVTTMTSLGRAMYDVVDSALGVIRGTSEVVCTVEDAYQAQRVCAALAEDFIAGDQTE